MSIIPEGIEYNIANIPPAVLMSWLVWILLIIPSLIMKKTYKLIPNKLQAFFEISFDWIFGLADEIIGAQSKRYYPLLVGIFFFILASNIIGLIPGFKSPTSDLNITIALALVVFFYYNFEGIRQQGWKYFAHLFGPPLPWYLSPVRLLMFIIEVIGHIARPFSMAMRLFCNIFSKELLLGILAFLLLQFFSSKDMTEKALALAPLLLRPFIMLLGLMLSFIQALVFLLLTIVYIGGAVNTEHHAHEAKEAIN